MYDKYEAIVNGLVSSVETGALTVETAELLNDIAYEKYVVEGANLDARRVLKDLTASYRRKVKDAKAAINAGDHNKAKMILKSLDFEITKAERAVDEISESTDGGSIILGFFFDWTVAWGRYILANLLTGGIAGTIWSFVKSWGNPIKKALNGENLSAADFNAYINQIKERFKEMHKGVKALVAKYPEISDALTSSDDDKE